MSENWKVGEKHGEYEVIAINPKEATFRKADGTEITCPNVFQDRATRGIKDKPKAIRKPKKTSTASDLDAIIAAAEAKKLKLASLKG